MKIKICCKQMKYYIEALYIEYDEEEKSATIDTSLYKENKVEINYCPFCGKKI